jgi:hypothetical protein
MKKVFTLIVILCFTLLSQAQNLPSIGTVSTFSAIEKEHAALIDRMIKEKTTEQRAKAPTKVESVLETEMVNPLGSYTLLSSTELRLTQAQNLSVFGGNSTISAIEEQYAEILARMTRENTSVLKAKALAATEAVSKIVTVKAGDLYAALTATERNTVTNLTVKGTIDARDFKTMRDNMTVLGILNLNEAIITAYTGTEGTVETGSATYRANTIPQKAFYMYRRLAFITLPSAIISIDTSAFCGCSSLTSVTIPSSVTNIRDFAFYLSGLTSISIPSSVTSIGVFALTGLVNISSRNLNYSSLEGILFNKHKTTLIYYPTSKTGNYTVPSSVISIESFAFNDCNNLTAVTIPFSVTSIGYYSFQSCIGLTSFTIPASVISIGSGAFQYCSGLSSIFIPFSVTSIGRFAFSCNALITVDDSNPNYSSEDGILFNKNKTVLVQCPISKTGSYTIPPTVTSIGVCAFLNCKYISSIVIPASITAMGFMAFYRCSGLTTLYAYPNVPVNLASSNAVFDYVNKTQCTLYVPSGSKAAYQSANQWQDFKDIVEMETNSTTKSVYVTAGGLSGALTTAEKSTLTDLTITGTLDARDFVTLRDYMPKLAVLNISGTSIVAYTGTEGTKGTDSYTYPANEIPQNAFFNSITSTSKKSLTSINLPIKVLSIGVDAFELCTGLISTTIPSSVTSIRDYAFFGCWNLTSVDLLSSVTSIGEGAFADIYGPINVAANNLNYSSQNGILFNKNKTTLIQCSISQTGSYTTPSTVSTIGNWAFYNCTNFTSINLTSSVTSIGVFSFNGTKISSINIPSSVITINTENCSFQDFSGSINVDSNNQYYSSQDGVLFNKDKSLLIQCPITKTGDYSVPSSVNSINGNAFYKCKSLTLINIPASVTTIGTWAFSSCTGLTSLIFPSSVTSIESYALFGCRNLTSIKTFKTIPVDLSTAKDVFWSVDKTTCILYVPVGSKSAYQSAVQWKDFSNIVEMDTPNGINEPGLSSGTKIYVSAQTVYVCFNEKNPKNARIAIYDMNGRLLISKIANEELTAIPIGRSGTYVVRVEAESRMQTRKIIIQ